MKWNPLRWYFARHFSSKKRGRKVFLTLETLEKREMLTLNVTPLVPPPVLAGGSTGNIPLASFVGSGGWSPYYQATIDWGDGATTSGVLKAVDLAGQNGYQVSGSHTYSQQGRYTAAITVSGLGDVASAQDPFTVFRPTIDKVTNAINQANQLNTSAWGSTLPGNNVTVIATDLFGRSRGPLTAPADPSGNWQVSNFAVNGLVDGPITYTVTATDAYGHTLSSSRVANKNVLALTVTSAPTLVTSINQTNVVVTGFAEAGATVTVVAGDPNGHITPSLTGTAGATGAWSVGGLDLSGLTDGSISFGVNALDGYGNLAITSRTASKHAQPPAIALVSGANPVNSVNQFGAGVVGSAGPDTTITLVARDAAGHATAPVTTNTLNGSWLAYLDVSTLGDGPVTYTATATDAYGNSASNSLGAVKDTQSPAITSVTDPITSGNQLSALAVGWARPGTTVKVTATDNTTSTPPVNATADSQGRWSVTGLDVSKLADGPVVFTVTAADPQGSQTASSRSAVKNVLGLAITAAPSIVNTAGKADVVVTGLAEVGARVRVIARNAGGLSTSAVSVDADSAGLWSASLDASGLADGFLSI